LSKNFEEKIKKSKEILDTLVSDDINLDKALKLYKDGMNNLNDAQDMLDNAKLEFQDLINKYDETKD
jgi:exodeoxyribonuclease VII small subunit